MNKVGVSSYISKDPHDKFGRAMGNYMYSDFEDCGPFIAKTKKAKNLYAYIYEPDNIIHSVAQSQRRKAENRAVKRFNKNYIENCDKIYWMLANETYNPGRYTTKTIFEPKERLLSIPPYMPDRIIDHCVVNVLEPVWLSVFIHNTFSCIKGRGIHGCMEAVNAALMSDFAGTRYALKIDIKKFYDNIDHAVLKRIIRYRIADAKVLALLDKIIDSNGREKGLPIGRFTSQYLANLYLSYFDHYCLEVEHCKYYFRYMDDIVVLSDSKEFLHNLLTRMGLYLGGELHLEIKSNWQVFPVDCRDIDFVGFRQNHYDVRMRKSILMRFYRKFERTKRHYSLEDERDFKHAYPSEYGWITACSPQHKEFLIKKCTNNESPINQAA